MSKISGCFFVLKQYFSIQFTRLVRYFEERGFSVVLAIVLVIALFAGGTYLLDQRTSFAPWVILGIQVVLLFPLTSKKRYDHLQLIFKSKKVFKVRALENLLISIPFMVSLAVIDWKVAFASFLPVLFLALKMKYRVLPFSLPTPFQKIPVYFPSGFRKYLFGHLLTIVVAVFGISIQNYNLGIFSIVLNWLFIFGYFGKVEPLEYVWIYAKSPKKYLLTKVKEGIVASSIIILPFVLIFIVVDWTTWYIPLLIYVIGLINLINLILASYVSFPDEITLPNGILIAISLMLPPLAIVGIGYFYSKARFNLKTVLNDSSK